jgi:hypothetical protein
MSTSNSLLWVLDEECLPNTLAPYAFLQKVAEFLPQASGSIDGKRVYAFDCMKMAKWPSWRETPKWIALRAHTHGVLGHRVNVR